MILNEDVVENLLSFIDSPKDLLALALSSKQLYNLIIPNHLHLRHIRCDPLLVSLWSSLSNKPAFCRRIRRLELVPTGSHGRGNTKVPTFLVQGEEMDKLRRYEDETLYMGLEILTTLTGVISQMSSLRRFCWIDIRVTDGTALAALFQQIHISCPLLEELEVDADTKEPVLDFDLVGPSPWNLSNLSSISIAIKLPSEGPVVAKMMDMLIHRCPGLQELALLFFNSVFPVTPIFQHAHWPHMRRLTFVGNLQFDGMDPANDPGSTISMAEFWAKHTRLECLFFLPWNPEGPPFIIFPGSLPQIRSLSLYHRNHQPLVIPFDVAQRITYFCLFIYHDVKREMILAALESMTSLKYLVMTRWPRDHLGRLAQAIPQVERLKFIRPLVSSWGGYEDYQKMDMSHIHGLSRLTHLSGLAWVKHATNPPEALLANVAANMTLRFVGITPMSQKDAWLRIERDYEGNYTGWKAENDSYDLNWKNWGDIFHGIVPSIY